MRCDYCMKRRALFTYHEDSDGFDGYICRECLSPEGERDGWVKITLVHRLKRWAHALPRKRMEAIVCAGQCLAVSAVLMACWVFLASHGVYLR